jgi:acyl dehydratase
VQQTAQPRVRAGAQAATGPKSAPAASELPLTVPVSKRPPPRYATSCLPGELRVGDELAPLERPPLDRVQIARYAVAAGELRRLHLDEPYAVAAGFRSVLAPGALAMADISQLLTRWLATGRLGRIERLSSRFVKLVRPGDELTSHARIAELRRETGACFAELEMWVENQKGELVLRGHATCALPEGPVAGPAAPSRPLLRAR